MTTTTFTLRMKVVDHTRLRALALSQGRTPGALAREILAEGLRDRMDPAAINRRMDAIREEMLDVAGQLRDRSHADERS